MKYLCIRWLTAVVLYGLIGMPVGAQSPGDAASAHNWPQWRGPLGTGGVPTGDPPIEWSEDRNIRWKTRIPGIGYGTPVIWENQIFICTAIEAEGAPTSAPGPGATVQFILAAVDRLTGQVRWQRVAREEIPHEGHHLSTDWAMTSPVTDGRRVYAFFGSRGLYCYTMDGELLWEKDFGDMQILRTHGESSSPALYGDRVVIKWDHEGQSFILALDARTGKEMWRVNRVEGSSWSTPLIVEHDGGAQVITVATEAVRSYDLATGAVIWEGAGLTDFQIATPVAADGVVYVTSGYQGSSIMRAIRLADAKGDIRGSRAVLWSLDRDAPYVSSPLLHQGLLYFLKLNRGILSCVDAATGRLQYTQQRLEGIRDIHASPVGAGDWVYLVSRDGQMLVIRHGPEFSVVAQNSLDDQFDASPVVVGDEIYLRGHRYLYCIARP